MADLLILQIRRIGDLALTIPLFASLQAAGHRVDALIPEFLAPLLQSVCPEVRAIPWLKGALLRTLTSLRASKYDALLDLTRSDRSAFLTRCTRSHRRIGYAEYARGWKRLVYSERHDLPVSRMHTLDYHLGLARAAGLIEGSGSILLPRPAISAEVRSHLADGGPWIVIHPGTAKPEKFWPAAHWRTLIGSLAEHTSARLVLTGGSDTMEQQAIAEILTDLPVPVLNLSGRLSIADSCALAANAAGIVSVDTGIMHLASLWQVPQAALFGPTQPFQWMPRHPRAAVLSSGSFRAKGQLKLKRKQRQALHSDPSEWEPFDAVADRLRTAGEREFHIGFREGGMAVIQPSEVLREFLRVLNQTPAAAGSPAP